MPQQITDSGLLLPQPVHEELHQAKRQKLAQPIPKYLQPLISSHDTTIHENGTITPVLSDPSPITTDECTCGFLHGPGQGAHEDIKARLGTTINLLRGPD